MTNPAWKKSEVSPHGTHHIIDGVPMYDARFLYVLSFHEPGLAAVYDHRGAWHIDGSGNPAYDQVFNRTFGFYENLAAVETDSGCFHITPDGASAYQKAYQWCGNFQEGRSVVYSNDGYAHILPNGNHLSGMHYLYAGDFRERRAVVRLFDRNLCAHIDENGAFAHPFRYREAGVYHKGFACAKDEDGWMHIDMSGVPIYQRRFATLEPFYNGRALAETLEGDMVVIDERGNNVIPPSRLPASRNNTSRKLFEEISSDMTGYWKTNALAAAVELRVAEKFPFADENAGQALDLPAGNARILIRALQELDIVYRQGDLWILTGKGQYLLPNRPHSLAQAAQIWSAFSEAGAGRIIKALRGNEGTDVFSAMAPDREKVKMLQGMLESYAAHDYASLPEILPLDGINKLIDAGGGTGVTARLINARRKDLEIIVLERREVLDIANLENIAGIKTHPGDVFLPWQISADAVLMCRVLHDWSNEKCRDILKQAYAALPRGGKIFIVESARNDAETHGLCSLHLLATTGGQERTIREYQGLLEAGQFKFVSAHVFYNDIHLITGEKS